MSGFSKVTIKDVALKADVSIATVSLVISGSSKVAAKTRRKVLLAIDELKYIPNEYAASLRKGKRDVFAALIPDMNNPYYLGIVRGLRDQCVKQDIVLHVSETRHNYETEKAEIRFLRGIQTSGYAFIGTVLDDDLIESLSNCSIVSVDKVYGYVDQYPQILINNQQCIYRATSYLASKGCKSIWYITPPIWTFGLEDRLNGYKTAMEEAGLPHEDQVCISYDSQMNMMEAGYIQMNLILSKAKPDAVIATSDMYAIGAMRAIREKGLTIPDDISVVGFDNSEFSRYCSPSLTTFSLPLRRMGEMAFEFLTGGLDNKIGKMIVSADFIVRDSVRQ
jgi:DNA-binding LacI/PurR family transcriptional regulator